MDTLPLSPPILASLVTAAILIWSFACPPLSYLLAGGRVVKWRGKHVLVTGGSKGLGKSLCLRLARDEGAFVTLVARTKQDVDDAVHEIETACKKNKSMGKVQGMLCDVTNENQVQDTVKAAEATEFGPIDHVVACAGMALTGKFLDRPLKDFESQMRLNYLGTVAPVKVVVANMVSRAQRGGKIILVSSQAALTGCVGYSAYCPTKFAVRGLGETLRNELLPHGIDVHVAFPGNMKTPGYEIEQSTKPPETKEIEAGEPLQEPDEVARAMLCSLHKGEYALYGGNYSCWAVGRVSAGLTPHSSLLFDLFITPILVLVVWGHRTFVLDSVVVKHKKQQ